MQLKSKMAQLNIALDKAVHESQAARGTNSISARLPPPAPTSGNVSSMESPAFDNVKVTAGSNVQLQLDLQK